MSITASSAVSLAMVVLCGCTQISVHEGDGTVTQERSFGAVILKAEPGTQPILFQAKGLGVVTAGNRVTLGYVNADYALLPVGDCRIVIWIDKDMKVQALDAVRDLGDRVCLAGPGAAEISNKGE